MRIAIIDDIPEEIDKLEDVLKEELYARGENTHTLYTYQNGETFLSDWTDGKFDLIILDIYMDGLSGIEVAREIRKSDQDVQLVFCTTSNEFASESYEMHAHFYLHKPYSRDQIILMLDRLNWEDFELKRTLTLPDGQKVLLRNVRYTEYSNHALTIHTKKSEDIRTYITQAKAEELFCAQSYFLVCTKGIIVNLYEVDRMENGTFRLHDGTILPISRRKSKTVQEQFATFTFEQMRKGANF